MMKRLVLIALLLNIGLLKKKSTTSKKNKSKKKCIVTVLYRIKYWKLQDSIWLLNVISMIKINYIRNVKCYQIAKNVF